MASTHLVPIIWGGRRFIPHHEEDFGGAVGDMVDSSNVSNQPPPPIVGSEELSFGFEVVDSDEEMQPFDAESFVDRLVEDDPPPRFASGSARGGGIWEAPVAVDTSKRGIGEIGNNHPPNASIAAKLFLQPIFSWPEPGREAGAHGVEGQLSQDKPVVVPNDPILDTLFTPARISSPEVAPGVTLGLVKVPSLDNHRGSRGCHRVGIAGFEPGAIYNIPPPVDVLPPEPQVPWAPVRPGCGDFRLTSPGLKPMESAFEQCTTNYYGNGSDNALEPVAGAAYANATSSSIIAAAAPSVAPTRLIGADAFSEEYDDDRHSFLRKQEVARFVGPGYLAGPGKSRLITPEQRTSLVDWLSKVHAVAPAASGNGSPLSFEALSLAVNVLDRFLSTAEGGKVAFSGWAELKVASVACFGLASKYEDSQPPTLWGLAVVMTSDDNELGDGFRGADGREDGMGIGINGIGQGVDNEHVHATRKEIAAMEQRVSSALGYRLTVPTALSFLGVFIRRACLLGYLPEVPAAERVRKEAEQILLRVLRDSSSLSHLPSALAAAALYWASCTTTPGTVAPSSFTFFSVTGYQLESLCRCLRDMETVRIASGAGGMGRGGDGFGFGWAGAAFPEHAGRTLFGAGGGHPAISAL